MTILTVRALESLSPSAAYSYGLGLNDPHKEFIFGLIVYPRSDFLSHFSARYRNGVQNLTRAGRAVMKPKGAGMRTLCLEMSGREGHSQLGEHPQGVLRCGAHGTKALVPGTTNMGTELDSTPTSGREPKLSSSPASDAPWTPKSANGSTGWWGRG